MQTTKAAMAALTVFMLFADDQALALRCGNTLVSEGDRTVEVVMKCGEPAIVEKWEEETTRFRSKVKDGVISSRTREIEEWTYNFGPHRFLQFMRFVNGKLQSIKEGSYGFVDSEPDGTDKALCGPRVERGDRKIDVIKKCGAPFFKESRTEDRATEVREKTSSRRETITDGKTQILIEEEGLEPLRESRLTVRIDTWTYNFGPHYFLYFFTFENGRVTVIEQGGYGN